ncbi:hypothetical protein [Sphingosinicella sp.]|uniref:hypothetical protein n=1 Tax=Sphingosinicella sp. TaxID=1917971 RepID=UPI002610994A|nr:hypothetical protein [Sphingosinicella sp.]
MTAEIISFPRRRATNGIVHVIRADGGRWWVSHESSSGNSWGAFDEFDDTAAAVAHAERLVATLYPGAAIEVAEEVGAA